jgi:hypothetical protein
VSEIVRAFVVPPVVVPRVFRPRMFRRDTFADRGRLLNQRINPLIREALGELRGRLHREHWAGCVVDDVADPVRPRPLMNTTRRTGSAVRASCAHTFSTSQPPSGSGAMRPVRCAFCSAVCEIPSRRATSRCEATRVPIALARWGPGMPPSEPIMM